MCPIKTGIKFYCFLVLCIPTFSSCMFITASVTVCSQLEETRLRLSLETEAG